MTLQQTSSSYPDPPEFKSKTKVHATMHNRSKIHLENQNSQTPIKSTKAITILT